MGLCDFSQTQKENKMVQNEEVNMKKFRILIASILAVLLFVYTSPMVLAADGGSGDGSVSPTVIVPPDIEIGGMSRYHYFNYCVPRGTESFDASDDRYSFLPYNTPVNEVYAVLEGTLSFHEGVGNTSTALLQVGICEYMPGDGCIPIDWEDVYSYQVTDCYNVYVVTDVRNAGRYDQYSIFIYNTVGVEISGNLATFGLYNGSGVS